MVSLQCEFSCVRQAFHFDQNSFHTEGMNIVSLQCEFSCVLQAFRFDQNFPNRGHVYGFSPV